MNQQEQQALNAFLKDTPKTLTEGISLYGAPDFFVMVVSTGAQKYTFALTQQHAKKLGQYMNHIVTQYEKQFGTIDAEWTPGPASPIQPVDLSNPDSPSGDTERK